ncbi:uncharacterized protein B0H18DRAFT_827627, partial [Fomitopsis serialis]|uniref:uncharacterized protein n=1 Tax=Fomitopsis serialis TaxID=139415 RepID=UPI0020084CB0
MMKWITRREKMAAYEAFQKECLVEEVSEDLDGNPEDSEGAASCPEEVVDVGNNVKIAKYPPAPQQHLTRIQERHNAPGFSTALTAFINDIQPSELRLNRHDLSRTWLPFDRLDVYHQARFSPFALSDGKEEQDVVKSIPGSAIKGRKARFDTVIALENGEAESTGVRG